MKRHSLRSFYKAYVLLVLLVAYAFNFLDRQVLSVALESIKTELALSDTQLGVLTGVAFAVFYSILGIPIARWADRGNRSTIISLSLALISATVALCSAARTFTQMMVVRIGVGIGEAGVVPPAHSLVSSYFGRSERLRAMSIFLLGGPLSMAVGYLVGGWFTELYGWRAAFRAIAIPGVILTVLVRLTVKDPRTAASRVSSANPVDESEPITAGEPPRLSNTGTPSPAGETSIRDVLRFLWAQPTFRCLLLAFGVDYLCGNGLLQWYPVFFVRVHGMTTGALGTWLAINWGIGNAI